MITHFEWITIALSLISIIVIPGVVLIIRLSIKWTRVEDRLDSLVAQLKDDHELSERRLRFIEEHWMLNPPSTKLPRRRE